MALLLGVDHVNLTIEDGPAALEKAKNFYGATLGLEPRARPDNTESGRPGAWYYCGDQQVHLSPESGAAERNAATRRHNGFRVSDLKALRERLLKAGCEVRDGNKFEGQIRLFTRDPFGNR